MTTQFALNAAEAEGIRKVMVKYLAETPTRRSAPFTVAWMQRLHRDMFSRIWTWAGEFRTHETNIGSPAHQVSVELHRLALDLRVWEQSKMDFLEQAVRLHHGAVRIHPFSNGNGHWSRLLANIWLKMHGAPLIFWPEPSIGVASEVRGEYLDAIRAADRGEFAPLLALHQRFGSEHTD